MKRVLTLFIVLCALLSLMVPITAFAAESEPPLDYSDHATPTDVSENKEITVTKKVGSTNPATPTSGILKLIKRGAGSGQPLSGAVFEVSSLSDNQKVGEVTSGSDGTAELTLTPGEYYLLEKTAPSGYKLETARIPFRVKAGNSVKVEITNMKDDGGQPIQPAKPYPPSGGTSINIPKTGEEFPTTDYTLAGVMFIIAGGSGFALWKERATRRRRV